MEDETEAPWALVSEERVIQALGAMGLSDGMRFTSWQVSRQLVALVEQAGERMSEIEALRVLPALWELARREGIEVTPGRWFCIAKVAGHGVYEARRSQGPWASTRGLEPWAAG